MVSTRGPRSRYFEKGELVLCYEPDVTKAKVLYDSKILGIYETKDKRGRKIIQYKVHFQGWSSSWDRKVNADFVLKDTEENRQLQRDLAGKAHLQLGAYLYRKERSNNNKKRTRKIIINRERGNSAEHSSASSVVTGEESNTVKTTTPEASDEKIITDEKHEEGIMKDVEGDSCGSSFEGGSDDKRVLLRISERLRQYLEYDHDMIVSGRKYVLPARVPIITILDNFVRQTTVNMIFSATQNENTRRRTMLRNDKKEREYDKLLSSVNLLKEIADGLRIYFDFTLVDYLLYNEEREYIESVLSEDLLKNFTYIPVNGLLPNNNSNDIENIQIPITDIGTESQSSLINIEPTPGTVTDATTPTSVEEPPKRKLRSHRSEDGENCLSSVASNSSGASTPLHTNGIIPDANYSKCLETMTPNLPTQINTFLQEVLLWRMIPESSIPMPCMIFGAPHLGRLLVKLPEFLNASTIADEKLKLLLTNLDTFINYLESRKEWFAEDNYMPESNSNGTPNESKYIEIKLQKSSPQSEEQYKNGQKSEDIESILEITEEQDHLENGYKKHIYHIRKDAEYNDVIHEDDIELIEHELEFEVETHEDYNISEENKHENNESTNENRINSDEIDKKDLDTVKPEILEVDDDIVFQLDESLNSEILKEEINVKSEHEKEFSEVTVVT